MKLFSSLNFKKLKILSSSKYFDLVSHYVTDIKNLYSTQDIIGDADMAKEYYNKLTKGNRAYLAQSITLVESTLPEKKRTGQMILSLVMQNLRDVSDGKSSNSFRIGLTGPPGAGKSTFIEAFGTFLISKGHKVAVLAVDPSSKSTGGSLMGDKTRMPELTLNPKAYIRPSPSGGTLGGVARNTMEAIVLCEGAGYDIVLVETMGVGQSEFAVADMVDMFCLILPPAGGDELQGLKRGIVEVSDLIIVNKFDGELMAAARRVASEYLSALKFIRKRHPNWRPTVCKVSSIKKMGFDELWTNMSDFYKNQNTSNRIEKLRRDQRLVWMWNHVRDEIMRIFEGDKNVQIKLKSIEEQVKDGYMSPGMAADSLLNAFQRK